MGQILTKEPKHPAQLILELPLALVLAKKPDQIGCGQSAVDLDLSVFARLCPLDHASRDVAGQQLEVPPVCLRVLPYEKNCDAVWLLAARTGCGPELHVHFRIVSLIDSIRKDVVAKFDKWVEVTKERGLGSDDRFYREGMELSVSG